MKTFKNHLETELDVLIEENLTEILAEAAEPTGPVLKTAEDVDAWFESLGKDD